MVGADVVSRIIIYMLNENSSFRRYVFFYKHESTCMYSIYSLGTFRTSIFIFYLTMFSMASSQKGFFSYITSVGCSLFRPSNLGLFGVLFKRVPTLAIPISYKCSRNMNKVGVGFYRIILKDEGCERIWIL